MDRWAEDVENEFLPWLFQIFLEYIVRLEEHVRGMLSIFYNTHPSLVEFNFFQLCQPLFDLASFWLKDQDSDQLNEWLEDVFVRWISELTWILFKDIRESCFELLPEIKGAQTDLEILSPGAIQHELEQDLTHLSFLLAYEQEIEIGC